MQAILVCADPRLAGLVHTMRPPITGGRHRGMTHRAFAYCANVPLQSQTLSIVVRMRTGIFSMCRTVTRLTLQTPMTRTKTV